MKDIKYINEKGEFITVSLIGFFSIDDLQKEYIIYSITDNNPNNEYGKVLLGEVIRNNNEIKILGIKKEEKDLVVAYYNEISNQIGE